MDQAVGRGEDVADRVGRSGVRAAGAEGRVEPRDELAGPAGVDVEDVDGAGPAGEQGVGRRGAGTTGPEYGDPSERGPGQAVRSAAANPDQSVLCPGCGPRRTPPC